MAKKAEQKGEVIDTSDYRMAGRVKAKVERTRGEAVQEIGELGMDIRQFLDKEKENLHLVTLQVGAFTTQYRGRILSHAEWKDIIHGDLTRRIE